MFEIISLILLISLVLIYVFLYVSGYNERIPKHFIRNKLAWCIIAKPFDLLQHIKRLSAAAQLQEKYQIKTEIEIDLACKIIEEYQTFRKPMYFDPPPSINLMFMSEERFFMKYIESAFESREFKKQLEESNVILYAEKSKDEHTTTYSLSDIGTVYYKLWYLVLIYCVNNKKLNKYNDYYSDGVKKIIEENHIYFYN